MHHAVSSVCTVLRTSRYSCVNANQCTHIAACHIPHSALTLLQHGTLLKAAAVAAAAASTAVTAVVAGNVIAPLALSTTATVVWALQSILS
jgi:hypothetical protein